MVWAVESSCNGVVGEADGGARDADTKVVPDGEME